jgi:SAM-dependent methyltransferase
MPGERPTGAYTHGYGGTVVRVMADRTAEREGAFLLRHLRAGMRLIDVGCGPGTITVGLAAAVAPGEVLGIDLEPAMIDRARTLADEQGLTNVRFEVGRAEELPAPDASFDAAFEHTLLEHVPDPLRVLREMRRVLRPGGVVGLADGDWGTMLVEPPLPAMADALALYERVWRHNGGNARLGRHQRALMRQAGLRPGETTARGDSYPPQAADALVAVFLGPRIADQAIALGWVDRPSLERYAEGIRAWGQHPDALLITSMLQTVGWRV